jgi:GNAT superfamily N-acetyltransferase
MIRAITSKDKTTILKYTPLFWEEIKGEELAGKLSLESFANFLEVSFRNETLVGWFYEENKKIQGGILFSIVSDIFTNKLLLKEIFWFVLPDQRNSWTAYKLIKQAEKFAIENNIDSIFMAHMANPNPEKLSKFYKKIGYNFIQAEYAKKIS